MPPKTKFKFPAGTKASKSNSKKDAKAADSNIEAYRTMATAISQLVEYTMNIQNSHAPKRESAIKKIFSRLEAWIIGVMAGLIFLMAPVYIKAKNPGLANFLEEIGVIESPNNPPEKSTAKN